MARTPAATGDSVPQDQKAIFNEISQQRGGAFPGLTSVMINVPEVAIRGAHLSEYLRRESTLPSKLKELAMLTTARELDCHFIWNVYAAAGRTAGLQVATVDNVRENKELAGLSPDEAAVVSYGQEFFRTHRRKPGHLRRRPGPVRSPRADRAYQPYGVLCPAGL